MLAGEQSTGTFVRVARESDDLRARFAAQVESHRRAARSPARRPCPGAVGDPARAAARAAAAAVPARQLRPVAAEPARRRRGQPVRDQGARGDPAASTSTCRRPFAERYPGPAFGVEGTRAADVGRPDGAMIGTIVKPSIGLSPAELAEVVARARRGGHRLHQGRRAAGQRPARAARRARARRSCRCSSATPTAPACKPMYAFNITDDIGRLEANHDLVRRGRRHLRDGVHQPGRPRRGSSSCAGHAACRSTGTARCSARSAARTRWGSAFRAWQKLARLAGADHLHTNGISNKFYETDDEVLDSIAAVREPLLGTHADPACAVVGPVGRARPRHLRRPSAPPTCSCSPAAASTATPTVRPPECASMREAWASAARGESVGRRATELPRAAPGGRAVRAPSCLEPRVAFYGDDFTGSVDALLQFARRGLDGAPLHGASGCRRALRRAADEVDVVGVAGIARSLPTGRDGRRAAAGASRRSRRSEPRRRAVQGVLDGRLRTRTWAASAASSSSRARCSATAPVPDALRPAGLRPLHRSSATTSPPERGTVYRLDRQPTMSHHPSTPMTEADLARAHRPPDAAADRVGAAHRVSTTSPRGCAARRRRRSCSTPSPTSTSSPSAPRSAPCPPRCSRSARAGSRHGIAAATPRRRVRAADLDRRRRARCSWCRAAARAQTRRQADAAAAAGWLVRPLPLDGLGAAGRARRGRRRSRVGPRRRADLRRRRHRGGGRAAARSRRSPRPRHPSSQPSRAAATARRVIVCGGDTSSRVDPAARASSRCRSPRTRGATSCCCAPTPPMPRSTGSSCCSRADRSGAGHPLHRRRRARRRRPGVARPVAKSPADRAMLSAHSDIGRLVKPSARDFFAQNAGMPPYTRTFAGVLGGLVGLVAAAARSPDCWWSLHFAPVLAISGHAASTAVSMFDGMPSYLAIDRLMLPTTIYARDPATGQDVELTSFYDQNRVPVKFDQVAPVMYDAILASEDPRFYEHGGIDILGTTRALIRNARAVRSRAARRSASSTSRTCWCSDASATPSPPTRESRDDVLRDCWLDATQASGVEGYQRKLQEIRYAVQVEQQYSKNDILLGYLNIANFGGTTYGIEAAARYYFSTTAAGLTLTQAATLAGIVQNPEHVPHRPAHGVHHRRGRRSPTTRPPTALIDDVTPGTLAGLDSLLADGTITPEQYSPPAMATARPRDGSSTCSTGCARTGASPPTSTSRRPSSRSRRAAARACRMRGDVRALLLSVRGEHRAAGPGLRGRVRRDAAGATAVADPRGPEHLHDAGLAGAERIAGCDATVRARDDAGACTSDRRRSASKPRRAASWRSARTTDSRKTRDVSAADPAYTSLVYAGDLVHGVSTGFETGSTFKLFTLVDWLETGHTLSETVNGSLRAIPRLQDRCEGTWINRENHVVRNFGGVPRLHGYAPAVHRAVPEQRLPRHGREARPVRHRGRRGPHGRDPRRRLSRWTSTVRRRSSERTASRRSPWPRRSPRSRTTASAACPA